MTAPPDLRDALIACLAERFNRLPGQCGGHADALIDGPLKEAIAAAEERGAQAMRLICAEMVSGLRIIETPRRAMWDVENAGIRHAERTILGAPLPRAYHGTAREAVLGALGGETGLKERGGGSAA